MSARHWCLGAVMVLATWFAVAVDARPYTMTDHLKLEALGRRSVSDPSGRWLVWEQTPPYDQLPDYGITRFGAWDGAGYRLMAVDLSASTPLAAPLFAADPQRSYWIDGFSPDGRYLVFYTAALADVTMGAYDFEQRKVVFFDASPAIKLSGGHRSVWVSADEFVFSALPAGAQPSNIGLRRYTGQRLWDEWQKAWRGDVPTVSEVNSHPHDEDDAFLQGRLLRANVRTGSLDVIADGQFAGLCASADGRFLAGLRQLRRVQPMPGAADVDWNLTRSQLYVFDLRKGGTARRVAPEKDVFPVTLAWAPDRPRLAFFAWQPGTGVRQGIFHALDAESGTVTPYPHVGLDLVSERERGFAEKPERVMWVDGKLAMFARAVADARAEPSFTYTTEDKFSALKSIKPDWFLLTPDGKHRKLTAQFKAISSIPVLADARSLTVLADGAVWRLGVGQAPRNLTAKIPGTWAYPSHVRYNTAHDPFTPVASFVDESGPDRRIALLDLRHDDVSVVTAPSAEANFMGSSPQRRTVLFRDRPSAMTRLRLRNADGEERLLATLNAHMAEVTPSRWQKISYTAQSHLGPRELESCALLPPDYQPGRRYPVIVDVYPGIRAPCASAASGDLDSFGALMVPWVSHLFAARGYIVLKPSTPSELIRTPDGPLVGMTDLVLQSADALIAQGYGDPRRLALFGVSQGGFSTLWLATQTARFQAIVSAIGWADQYSNYFEGMIYHKFYADEIPYIGSANTYEIEGGDMGLGTNPYRNPDRYLRNSPLFNSSKVTTPLLMVHTDMDVFNLAQYEMMFTSLYRQRKEVKFLRYMGEGHGTSSPANVRHSTAAMLAWFDRWLDVSRDEQGTMRWAGESAASREGAPARTAEWFGERQ